MHAAIYRAREDVRAVVHTHSPYATAVACFSSALPVLHDEGRHAFCERVPVAEYAPPGTWKLAHRAVEALGSGQAVRLARHGVVTVGPTLSAALALAEKLEETAKLYVLLRGKNNLS